MASFVAANGPDGQIGTGHQSVPIPAGLLSTTDSPDYLLTIDVSLAATTPDDAASTAAKEVRERELLIREGLLFVAGIAVLALGVWFFRARPNLLAFLSSRENGRASPERPAPSPKMGARGKHPGDPAALTEPAEAEESSLRPAEKINESESEVVERVWQRVDAELPQAIKAEIALDARQRVQELDRRERQIAAKVWEKTELSVDTAVKNEVERRLVELGGGSIPQLKRHLASLESLDTEIARKMEDSAMQWARSLWDNYPDSGQATVEPKQNLRRPQINDQARKILGAMRDLSGLALELLALRSRQQHWAASDWEETPMGKLILPDLRALESIVFVDFPLLMWALGELTLSPLTESLLRFGINKWRVSESGELDAPAVAREWAQGCVPVLQNLIEGAPRYFGSSDPSGFRGAVITLGERHPGLAGAFASPNPVEITDELYLNAASDLSQKLVATLYNSLVGVQYYRMQLFRDTLNSRDIPQVVNQSRSVYAFPASRELVSNGGVEDRHGLIVRISSPYIKSGSSGWSGSLYYLEEDQHA